MEGRLLRLRLTADEVWQNKKSVFSIPRGSVLVSVSGSLVGGITNGDQMWIGVLEGDKSGSATDFSTHGLVQFVHHVHRFTDVGLWLKERNYQWAGEIPIQYDEISLVWYRLQGNAYILPWLVATVRVPDEIVPSLRDIKRK